MSAEQPQSAKGQPVYRPSSKIAWVLFFISLGVIVIALILPALQQEREYAYRSYTQAQSLKIIGIAFLNYHDDHGRFPTDIIDDASEDKLLSWRVRLAVMQQGHPITDPEYAKIWESLNYSKPWDSANNLVWAAWLRDPFDNTTAESHGYINNYRVGLVRVIGVMNESGSWNGENINQSSVLYINDNDVPVLCVAVSEELAIPWTKPEDYTISKVVELLKEDKRTESKNILYVLLRDGLRLDAPFTWKIVNSEVDESSKK